MHNLHNFVWTVFSKYTYNELTYTIRKCCMPKDTFWNPIDKTLESWHYHYPHLIRGVPRIWEGGPRIFFFSDLGICMSRSDMMRMAKPCALLGGFGGICSPEKIFSNGAIWCVLGCILIRFCLYFFQKMPFFI